MFVYKSNINQIKLSYYPKMDLLLNIESKLKSINEKLKSTEILIHNRADSDTEKVNENFKNNFLNQIETNINEQRDLFLNELKEKRNIQLDEANELYSMNNLSKLETNIICFKAKINERLIYFNKNHITDLIPVLINCSFTREYDLFKKFKFSKFSLTKKRINFKLNDGYKFGHFLLSKANEFLIIKRDRYFLYLSKSPILDEIIIINGNGTILFSKELDRNEEQLKFLKLTGSYVIIFNMYKYLKTEGTLDIYDLKLNFITSFKLDESFTNFNTSKNEIAFQSYSKEKILFYDIDKSKWTRLNIIEDSLVGFNEDKIVLIENDDKLHYKIYFLDKHTKTKTYLPFKMKSLWYLKVDTKCRVLYLDVKWDINIYNSKGELESKFNLSCEIDLFASVRFTNWNSLVFNIDLKIDYIEYNEY